MWMVMVSIASSHNSEQMSCLKSYNLCPKSKVAVVPDGRYLSVPEGYLAVPEGYLSVPEGYLYKG